MIVLSKRFTQFATLSRFVIVIVLLSSGFLKLLAITQFQASLYKLAMIYDSYVPVLSYLIPITEILFALLLIFKLKTYLVSKALLVMFILFTAVLITKLIEGSEASCGCFGSLIDGSIGTSTILRNIGLLIICFIIYLNAEGEQNPDKKNLFSAIKKNSSILLVFTIIIFLSVLNFTFAVQNRALKNRIYVLIGEETLMEGETIKELKVNDDKGNPLTINFQNEEGYVIYIMKYGCNPCNQNQESWKFLFQKINKKRDIKGFSINDVNLTEFIKKEHKINYPLYSAPDEDFRSTFKVNSTPLTILLSNDGTVEKVFRGVLKEGDIKYLLNLK